MQIRLAPKEIFLNYLKGNLLAYLPGALLIAMAVCVVIAPNVIIALVSALFLFFGTIALVGAWKYIQLKRRIEQTMKQFQGKVFIQGINLRGPGGSTFEESVEEVRKKTVFH